MIVLIVEHPDSGIRGFLRRWFLEIKANVFVSSITEKQLKDILFFIQKRDKDFKYLYVSNSNCSQKLAFQSSITDPTHTHLEIENMKFIQKGENNEPNIDFN